MIRKYNAFVLWSNPPEGSKEPKIMARLGEVEGEEWFGARENASVKFTLPREKIELQEIPPEPVPPPVFDKGQRPPPVLTPHLRKQKGDPCAHCQGTGRDPKHPSFRSVTFITAANMCKKCLGTGVAPKKARK